MVRIIADFIQACAAPTRRLRRILCTVCLGGAVLLIVAGMHVAKALAAPMMALSVIGLSLFLLVLSVRLAFNDMRDLRAQYRQSRRELFVKTFSDEEFCRKVREKRKHLH